jgi:hypothetical protein
VTNAIPALEALQLEAFLGSKFETLGAGYDVEGDGMGLHDT